MSSFLTAYSFVSGKQVSRYSFIWDLWKKTHQIDCLIFESPNFFRVLFIYNSFLCNKKVAQPILILTKRQKKLFLRQVIKSKTKTKTKISKFYKCLVSSVTESTYVKLAKKEQKKKIAKNVRLFISN